MNLLAHDNAVTVAPLIDGVVSNSESEVLVPVINPSNGRRCALIPAGCAADVDRAVASASRAFGGGHWSMAPSSCKKKALHCFADLITSQAALLDAMDAQEMGKPIRERRFDAAAAANLMRFYAEAIDKVTGDVYRSDGNSFVSQRRVPRGVVAAVVPWNFPTFNAVLKIAPALAAGNSVILKPSELSSQSAMHLAHLSTEAGLPPGVLNAVPGLGETVGRALALHPHVDMVAFTGSSETGRRMLQYSGQSNMKVILAECGGKSPHVVFSDGADLDAASQYIAKMMLTNQGQICSVGSRLIVHRSVEAMMIERISAWFKQIVMGDALDPNTTFGPVASDKQCERVMQYIHAAESEGAELVIGGRRVLIETGGYFIEPTLFRNVLPTARIAQEEIFGPVLSVISFETEADAISIANGTMYGLAAYVWTADLSRGMRLARDIRSSVRVNAAAPAGEAAGHAPSFEAAGQSGVGIEGGVAGMESYLRRQLVWFNYA